MCLICGICLFVLLILYLNLNQIRRRPKRSWKLKKQTTGRVMSIDTCHVLGGGGVIFGSYKVPLVQYAVDDIYYLSNHQFLLSHDYNWENLGCGELVDIWYDAKCPSRFFVVPPYRVIPISGVVLWFRRFVVPSLLFLSVICFVFGTIVGPDVCLQMVFG